MRVERGRSTAHAGRRARGRRLWVVAALALVVAAVAAQTSSSQPAASRGVAATAANYTPADVKKATKPWSCGSVYAVPKNMPKLKIAFINPGPADPFVAAWSAAMKKAAKYYNVELKEGFLGGYDWSKMIDTYRTLSAFDPDVVGGLADDASGRALLKVAKADGRKVVLMDTILPGVPQVGLDNLKGGAIVGAHLKKNIAPLLKGAWSKRPIVVVGISAQGCVPCDQRVEGAFKVLRKQLAGRKSVKFLRIVEPTATVDVIQPRMTDMITANPNAAFVVASLDDESGGGAFNAIVNSGIEDRGRVASIGGDNLAVSNLLKGSPSYVASVDAKPFCEGWNWIEAAVAINAGRSFKSYPYTGVITPKNVKSFKWRLKIKF